MAYSDISKSPEFKLGVPASLSGVGGGSEWRRDGVIGVEGGEGITEG